MGRVQGTFHATGMIKESCIHSFMKWAASAAARRVLFLNLLRRIRIMGGKQTRKKNENFPTIFIFFFFHGLVLDQLRLVGQSTGQDSVGKMVHDHES